MYVRESEFVEGEKGKEDSSGAKDFIYLVPL